MGEEISTNTNSLFENRFPEYESMMVSLSATNLLKEILYVSIFAERQRLIKNIEIKLLLIGFYLIKKPDPRKVPGLKK